MHVDLNLMAVVQLRSPIHFLMISFNYVNATEITRQELVAVANTKNWDIERVDLRIDRRTGWFGNASGAAGDDDATRIAEFRSRFADVGDDGVHTQLADAAGDEVAVLPARVEDDDLVHGQRGPSVDAPASAPAGRPCPRS